MKSQYYNNLFNLFIQKLQIITSDVCPYERFLEWNAIDKFPSTSSAKMLPLIKYSTTFKCKNVTIDKIFNYL